jgi:MFS family permease
MAAPSLSRLATAIIGAHVVDQIVLALVPLALAAVHTPPDIIARAVAAQSAAWLLVTLPAGVLADRFSRRTLMCIGSLAVLLGSILAGAVVMAERPLALPLSAAAFLTSSGVVLLVLSVFALLPEAVGREGLARANGTFEFGRALAAVLAPHAVAALIIRGATVLALIVAAFAAGCALIASFGLSASKPASTARVSMLTSVKEGASFVVAQPILRAIAFCAVFWNIAFFSMIAIFPPYALTVLGLGLTDIATAWSVYGIGLLLGAAIAPWAIKHMHTGLLFVIGPLGSAAGLLCMTALAPTFGMPAVLVGFFSVGFLPMVWLVLQTSVRQIVTPQPLLARVAATISIAIYGVRPIGALIAGAIAAEYGVSAAMWFATIMFGLSLAAILVSPATALRTMPAAA